jgi:hypothetical protein
MKPIVLLKVLKLSFRRLEQSDPDKLGLALAIGRLVH